MSSSIFCRRGALGCSRAHFNPRTPCGVRQREQNFLRFLVSFQSTHPSRGATRSDSVFCLNSLFQSTHPSRGATLEVLVIVALADISIHAPLTGCDLRSAHQDSGTSYFNPRTPRGVRPVQPTSVLTLAPISIHAPLAGCDVFAGLIAPRLPVISIHAPLAGCDSKNTQIPLCTFVTKGSS